MFLSSIGTGPEAPKERHLLKGAPGKAQLRILLNYHAPTKSYGSR
jgi:hypothetical protein